MRRWGADRRSQAAETCIWAVAGGKGGVGKSVLASSLAIALARRGKRCVLVDADLGAANLHTMLGMPAPERTLSHFLSREVRDLSDVVYRTRQENLWLVSGARAMMDMANPSEAQKQHLLQHIRQLDVDHVFLDLSAGSSHIVLDLFLSAHRGLLVVIPEATSIENAYHFLKAAYYRWLRNIAGKPPVRHALDRIVRERGVRPMRSPLELITRVTAVDVEAGRALWERAKTFSPLLAVNQATALEHRRIGPDVSRACIEHLGVRIRYLGALERDECVRDAVKRGRPVLDLHPGSRFALGVTNLAAQIDTGAVAAPESAPEAHAPRRETRLSLHGLFDSAPPLSDERKPTASALPPPDLSHPGAYLKTCRERLELKLSDLCLRTRIRSLESIENERYDQLPPEPYLRHFVVQYAEALGIPETDALASSFLRRYRESRAGGPAPASRPA